MLCPEIDCHHAYQSHERQRNSSSNTVTFGWREERQPVPWFQCPGAFCIADWFLSPDRPARRRDRSPVGMTQALPLQGTITIARCPVPAHRPPNPGWPRQTWSNSAVRCVRSAAKPRAEDNNHLPPASAVPPSGGLPAPSFRGETIWVRHAMSTTACRLDSGKISHPRRAPALRSPRNLGRQGVLQRMGDLGHVPRRALT
jgi:hypothetical protein